MPSSDTLPFFTWLQAHNGFIDTSAIDIIDFPPSEGGRGAVALKDIPEGHTVFSIPRSLILTPRTSTLPARFGADAWRKSGLKESEGWSGLIMCMMWEASLGDKSKWKAYFDVMPTKFDTPMFWNDEELAELEGTAVVDKIGKEQVEKDYRDKVLPAIQSRPALFLPQDISTWYSLEMYHIMGTRILTRSFTLDGDTNDAKQDGEQASTEDPNTSVDSAMDVDVPSVPKQGAEIIAKDEVENLLANEDEGADDGEDDDEGIAEVALVPLADFLNARYKEENVKLFYDPDCLKMVSVTPIKAGEQIWNTYGDLPNSDLLRSFGHVDYLPMSLPVINPSTPTSETRQVFGNPGDIVEIRADLVVRCAVAVLPSTATSLATEEDAEKMMERIEWWLEEGGEDIFVLEIDSAPKDSCPSLEIPDALLSFTRLILSESEWERAKTKGKPPKPKADAETLRVLRDVLTRRMVEYPTALEDDERILSTSFDVLPINKRHAMIVRVGEKRILRAFITKVEVMLAKEMQAAGDEDAGKAKKSTLNGISRNAKRKAVDDDDGGKKKKR